MKYILITVISLCSLELFCQNRIVKVLDQYNIDGKILNYGNNSLLYFANGENCNDLIFKSSDSCEVMNIQGCLFIITPVVKEMRDSMKSISFFVSSLISDYSDTFSLTIKNRVNPTIEFYVYNMLIPNRGMELDSIRIKPFLKQGSLRVSDGLYLRDKIEIDSFNWMLLRNDSVLYSNTEIGNVFCESSRNWFVSNSQTEDTVIVKKIYYRFNSRAVVYECDQLFKVKK